MLVAFLFFSTGKVAGAKRVNYNYANVDLDG